MIPLANAASGVLAWSKIKGAHSLTLNGEVVASLHRASFWSSAFLAESRGAQWIFRRTGLLGSNAEIIDTKSNHRLATFHANWSCGGTLVFADGQVFSITSKGLWRPVWTVAGSDDQPVLRVSGKSVELMSVGGIPEGRLMLLTLFVWQRIQQAAEDAASVAVMVAAS